MKIRVKTRPYTTPTPHTPNPDASGMLAYELDLRANELCAVAVEEEAEVPADVKNGLIRRYPTSEAASSVVSAEVERTFEDLRWLAERVLAGWTQEDGRVVLTEDAQDAEAEIHEFLRVPEFDLREIPAEVWLEVDVPEGATSVVRWEAVRRILGHAAILETRELAVIIEDFRHLDSDLTVMYDIAVRYAQGLHRGFGRTLAQNGGEIEPVLPVMDLAGMQIKHETCTENTRFCVPLGHRGYHEGCESYLGLWRRIPLALDQPRDVVLAWLDLRPRDEKTIGRSWLLNPMPDRLWGSVEERRAAEAAATYLTPESVEGALGVLAEIAPDEVVEVARRDLSRALELTKERRRGE